ncbi:MAG: alpha-ketoglutarate-dependent dioxygenase AlkB [Anaerolineae bacterium]|nr:alpha-ketoglutarate-dependent dioxygenase AlkB [Anaerolineae bacterium]
MIAGLEYIPNFAELEYEAQLLAVIDLQPWLTDLKRRVQHYGYRYDYRARRIAPDAHLGSLPAWARPLAERVYLAGYTSQCPDQLIINEYLPGQGIAPHVDCEPCFGESIISLSLGSACEMRFTHCHSQETRSLWLERGSLLVMRGDARYAWQHGIHARHTDLHQGQRTPRGRRVSLTLRNVILGEPAPE